MTDGFARVCGVLGFIVQYARPSHCKQRGLPALKAAEGRTMSANMARTFLPYAWRDPSGQSQVMSFSKLSGRGLNMISKFLLPNIAIVSHTSNTPQDDIGHFSASYRTPKGLKDSSRVDG